MPSPLDSPDELLASLTAACQVLEEMGPDFSGVQTRLRELTVRLEEGRFRLAVLGQFKRGKSSLLNALLGEDLLPTGILPVTGIPTVLRYGPRREVRVSLLDGRREDYAGPVETLAEVLTRYVTERENPANRLGVAQVEVEHPAPLLAHGVEIIDTPGIGSTVAYNTKKAREMLPVCDGALFVLSPDPPITEVEAQFLAAVKDTVARVIIVLTKADLLAPSDERDLCAFVRRAVREQAGFSDQEPIFLVSARQALIARATADPATYAKSGFRELEEFLGGFLSAHKQAVLRHAVRAKAARLIGGVLFSLDLQRKAIELPRRELERKRDRFEAHLATLDRERTYFWDRLQGDRRRMQEEVDRRADDLVRDARARLTSSVQKAREQDPEHETSRARERRLRAAVSEESDRVFGRAATDLWAATMTRFKTMQDAHCHEFENLIERVRRTAADLFEVAYLEGVALDRLDALHEPRIIRHRPVTSFVEEAWAWIASVLPARLRAALFERRLRSEIEYLSARNAEELRWAVSRSLEDLCRAFEARMVAQLEATVGAIRGAVQSALDSQAQRDSRFAPELRRLETYRRRLEELLAALSPGGSGPYGHPV